MQNKHITLPARQWVGLMDRTGPSVLLAGFACIWKNTWYDLIFVHLTVRNENDPQTRTSTPKFTQKECSEFKISKINTNKHFQFILVTTSIQTTAACLILFIRYFVWLCLSGSEVCVLCRVKHHSECLSNL